MHRQFDVWRNAIECDMSMRTLDVSSLRRCVETFTHYVAEHAELTVWLELARAHLALVLGKPQEALAGYGKCMAEIQPGRALCWDTLCVGYAEALLACGDAPRAREFLGSMLQHPVVMRARHTSAWAMLDATLALAEAECGQPREARQRIEALESELCTSDHPLVCGFVQEVAARIAHRSRDEQSCHEHLLHMKNLYGSARNQALSARGQRVSDSLTGVRQSGAPASGDDSDHAVVTRVTARRDSSP
jgi:hypothetical protein